MEVGITRGGGSTIRWPQNCVSFIDVGSKPYEFNANYIESRNQGCESPFIHFLRRYCPREIIGEEGMKSEVPQSFEGPIEFNNVL